MSPRCKEADLRGSGSLGELGWKLWDGGSVWGSVPSGNSRCKGPEVGTSWYVQGRARSLGAGAEKLRTWGKLTRGLGHGWGFAFSRE